MREPRPADRAGDDPDLFGETVEARHGYRSASPPAARCSASSVVLHPQNSLFAARVAVPF